ncbi:sulfatase family protein [Phaeodactylibacter xiamenensis]|uniref:sulfatase family protein n=1 Tax=Phaeodactylibacter xiamenensis TaxID=1524460 RepID=UPI003CCC01E4
MIGHGFEKWIFPALLAGLLGCSPAKDQGKESTAPPNIILLMADDLGWGDTGYNGHPVLQTPNLDSIAAEGVALTRFYAAAPVCSPTRGSCLTGRHPNRYGIFSANVGHLPEEELTLAELLKAQGYLTGHFGKWHLGTLTRDTLDANRGGKPQFADEYAPPWLHGFETCFSTESKVPTWDPMRTPEKAAGGVGSQGLGNHFGTFYWNEQGERVENNLKGDDSRVIMDRAIDFITEAADQEEPFFAVIWFHAPHTPVVAGPKYLAQYEANAENEQHYYGCISAMDEQIGRLRSTLKNLGLRQNTLTFFTSDNGPENRKSRPRSLGITKGLSERKRSLKEGGIRVPGLVSFPGTLPAGQTVDKPFSTSDYLPTILELTGIAYPDDRPLDGKSMLPWLAGETDKPAPPLFFDYQGQVAIIDGQYKLYKSEKDAPFELYDLTTDPAELKDQSEANPKIKAKLIDAHRSWRASVSRSLKGTDY